MWSLIFAGLKDILVGYLVTYFTFFIQWKLMLSEFGTNRFYSHFHWLRWHAVWSYFFSPPPSFHSWFKWCRLGQSTWSWPIQLPCQMRGIHGQTGSHGMILVFSSKRWSGKSYHMTQSDRGSGRFSRVNGWVKTKWTGLPNTPWCFQNAMYWNQQIVMEINKMKFCFLINPLI